MLTLSAKIRKIFGKETDALRKEGVLPAVLYGHNKKTQSIEVDYKKFENIYEEAGENTLISIEVEDKKTSVLVHDVQLDPVSGKFLHIDFYQVNLEEKIEAKVPLVFEGEPLAVKELGGTLVKVIHEVEVKAKPENLPKEIKVDISVLKTFENHLLIKDLVFPTGVEVLRKPEDLVAEVKPAEKVEEELAKPVEEKVEEVEKVEKEKKEEKTSETEPAREETK